LRLQEQTLRQIQINRHLNKVLPIFQVASQELLKYNFLLSGHFAKTSYDPKSVFHCPTITLSLLHSKTRQEDGIPWRTLIFASTDLYPGNSEALFQ